MRLAPLRLHRPETVERASELLDELGGDAVPYCGGTELLLVAKLGLTEFTDLIDIKAIDELAGIESNDELAGPVYNDELAGIESNDELAGIEPDDALRIGATTTHRQIERSDLVRRGWPSLAGMERAVGNLRVRNVGTIGGNLCFADPHSDPATYLLAAGGSVSIRRGGAQARKIPVQELVRGPYRTVLEPGELLLAVHIPRLPTGSALIHRKLSFHERPAITVAANVCVRDGSVESTRLAIGSVGGAPQRVTRAEQILIGCDALSPGDEQLAACAEAAASESEPVVDSNGSVLYKRQLVRVLTGRCLRAALAEAISG